MILGIDIGTTSSKAVVLDGSLNVIGEARIAHSVETLRPGFVEQNSEIWWADLCQLAKSLSKKLDLAQISAVGLSSMGPNILPVSSEGKALRSGILYGIDTRASFEISELSRILKSDEIAHIFGRYSSQSILPKILWIKNNQKEIFESANKFLTTNGYIGYRLTGKYAIDYFSASAGGLIDFSKNTLYESSLEAVNIPSTMIPDLLWPGDILGTITSEAASATGLSEGTMVIAGTTDAANEAVICGCHKPGESVISLGGTSIFVTCTDKPVLMENALVCNYLDNNSFIIGGATGSGGLLIDWFSENICSSAPEKILSLIPKQRPYKTELVALPYLNGARNPLNDKSAKGLIVGLTNNSQLQDIYMAFIESLAMEIEMMIEDISKKLSINNNLRVTGGGSNNEVLVQTICEVLHMNVEVLPKEMGSAAGAAVLAGAAQGYWTIDQATRMVPVRKIYKNSGNSEEYFSIKKEIFRKAYRANQNIFADLDNLAGMMQKS
jgi:xylulokinase